jgi:uncharacterized RDD family membrane protein YckC
MQCPRCHRETSAASKRCTACGWTIPPGQHLLEQSGMLGEDAPARKAHANAEDLDTYRTATLGNRFVAFVLDTLFLFGIFIVVDAWAFMRWGTVEGAELRLTAASLTVAGLLNATILFAYGWLLEAGFGATLGKAIVGIRVVRYSEGHPLAVLAIRNLLRIVDGLGFYVIGALVAGCSGLRRRVGDLCAGTAVVEEEFGVGIKSAAVGLWILVLAGAAWAVPRICKQNTAAQPPRYLNQVVVQVGTTEKSAYFQVARLRIDVGLASALP